MKGTDAEIVSIILHDTMISGAVHARFGAGTE